MDVQIRENPGLCYQCAKCSAGCPLAEEMDMLPHQIIHALALGSRDRALQSNTIWMCAGCYTCAVRCPNDINITAVMDDLRGEAVHSGLSCPKPEVLKFHKAFLRDLSRRGRVHELRLMGEYNLSMRKPFHNAMLGPKMFLRGRLNVFPPRALRGFARWMKSLWKRS